MESFLFRVRCCHHTPFSSKRQRPDVRESVKIISLQNQEIYCKILAKIYLHAFYIHKNLFDLGGALCV